jgi:hypothetical protein
VKHEPGRETRPGSWESAWAADVQSWLHLRATCVRLAWNVLIRRCGSRDSEAWVDGVRFALLGTLVRADGGGNPVGVSGARQRALLAADMNPHTAW